MTKWQMPNLKCQMVSPLPLPHFPLTYVSCSASSATSSTPSAESFLAVCFSRRQRCVAAEPAGLQARRLDDLATAGQEFVSLERALVHAQRTGSDHHLLHGAQSFEATHP